jgi:hypothetical protein
VYSADGHPNMEKERLEVLAGGRSATVVDFRQVILNGRSSKGRRQDKGHGPQMRAFLDAVRTGSSDTNWAIASTRTTLDAAATLTGTVSRNTRDH